MRIIRVAKPAKCSSQIESINQNAQLQRENEQRIIHQSIDDEFDQDFNDIDIDLDIDENVRSVNPIGPNGN